MIIIEGVDNSGKSTLAVKVADALGLDVEHFGVPEGNPCQMFVTAMNNLNKPVVYDRFFHSEIPYSIVKQRPRYMKFLEFSMLELMAMSKPHLLVYCRPSRKVVNERYSLNGDNYVNLGEINKLYDEYDELMCSSNLRMVTYDGEEDPARIIEAAKEACDERLWNSHNVWRKQGMPGIGTLKPKYLFVGERYNLNAPFKVTFWSKSGQYLLMCLMDAGIDIKECHFTNSISLLLDKLTNHQIQLLQPERVIALGEIAWHIIKEIAPKQVIKRVAHPAYSSRFPWEPRSEYVKKLRGACGLG